MENVRGNAYATGEALYALHISGDVPTNNPVYQKGVQWLLRKTSSLTVPGLFPREPHRASRTSKAASRMDRASFHRTAVQAGLRWLCFMRCRIVPR